MTATFGSSPASESNVIDLRVDARRMIAQIEELATINRQPDGSCCRVALTDADTSGRKLVLQWMEEAGLEISVDEIGNIVGLRKGLESGPPVMTGSHIDTVATGGRYDGVLGVLGGLEILRSMNDAEVHTKHPLAVAIFTNEEGVRYQPDMMGSLVYSGGLTVEDAHNSIGTDGTRLKDELGRAGFLGAMPCGHIVPRAYVELHIEQGPILDSLSESLGAVEALQAILWKEFIVRGTANHAGTTPMAMRKDAALAAAEITSFVRRLAVEYGAGQLATVGQINISPNLVNVVAREARVVVDLRNIDESVLFQAERRLSEFVRRLAEREHLKVESRQLAFSPSVQFDEHLIQLIDEVSAEFGHKAKRMVSGAGHDAQMIARIAPSAMIFVPSKRGISHNPREETTAEHLELGANVLLQVMLRLAEASHTSAAYNAP